jgi:ABC-type antimicrobial peptide transport system permease subunit
MLAVTRTFKSATIALRRNVMRSALTCLGIIIGVSAVIAMMEIGHGSSESIKKSLSSMGANTVLVLPGTAASGGVTWGAGSAMTLTPEDCDAILANCSAVHNACPIVRAKSSQVIYGGQNWIPSNITGATPAILDIQNWGNVIEGQPFTDADVRNASKVCLLGQTLVQKLFNGRSPVGKDIRLANVSFRVVGALKAKGANMFGQDQDDVIIAPWTTIKYRVSGTPFGGAAQASSGGSSSSSSTSDAVNTLSNLYPSTSLDLYPDTSSVQAADTPQPVRFANVDQILVTSVSTTAIPQTIAQITQLLHDRHHIRAGQPDDFQTRDFTEMSSMLTSTTTLMTGLLMAVAMLSLLVGGVGIMNIMLVSVTERTREIGLRMAVGARGRDILQQFLIEAIILCLFGGAIGILLGRGGSILVHLVLGWPTEISVPAIVASVIVSASVGMIFGFYPAWKASRLDPIEALRYE